MLISEIINDGIGLLSKQLKFYCWHYKRDLDRRQREELIDLLNERYFEKLAFRIRLLLQSNIDDCKQQIGKLLFEQCLVGHRRNQLKQLIESDLVDINVRLDNYGRTLLHRTAYNLDVDLVKLLIEHGVNIRLRDYAGNTALHIAIQSYRNGALIYNDEPKVVQNLTSIIELLLEADKGLQLESALRKRIKLDSQDNEALHWSDSSSHYNQDQSTSLNHQNSTTPEMTINAEHSSAPRGQQHSLVSYQSNSPPKNGTICRIVGSNCVCRKKSIKSSTSNNLHDTSTDGTSKSPESQKSELSSPRGSKQSNLQSTEYSSSPTSPTMLMEEDPSIPLIDTKNAFGRTALHYCVLVVGEQHLDHFVSLLIAHGADVDVIDTRLKTPLYCLVKRPGVAAVKQKCLAITKLIESGCDDLGLALDRPRLVFSERYVSSLVANIAETLSRPIDEQVEPIFTRSSFKRVPNLKHLARLKLIKIDDAKHGGQRRQRAIQLPSQTPRSLSPYVNRKILDQSELF